MMNEPLVEEMMKIYQIMIEDTQELIDQNVPAHIALEKVEENILECLSFFRTFKEAELEMLASKTN